MKKSFVLLCVFASACLLPLAFAQPDAQNLAHDAVKTWLLGELNQTKARLNQLLSHLSDKEKMKKDYEQARMHYKHVELFVEYLSPRPAKYFINGPLVPKFDDERGSSAIEPNGFQKLEELLYSGDETDTLRISRTCASLVQRFVSFGYNNNYQKLEIPDGQLLEICQLQLVRIASMNLNGYDATINLHGIRETAYTIEGIEAVLKPFHAYTSSDKYTLQAYDSLLLQLSLAKKELQDHPDYNTFNRLDFIADHINPINRFLIDFHNSSRLPWSGRKQALDVKQPFLFGKESFDLRFFTFSYGDTGHQSKQAELGKLLFFDPVMSGNGRRSCASCHHPAQAFTDGQRLSTAMNGFGVIARNAPTLMNVAYQQAFFYDGRARQLEQQLFEVVHNNEEMESSMNDVAEKLKKSSAYRKLFATAFAGTADSAITIYGIARAIMQFEKTLVSFNSRFDQYLRGNKIALNKREVNGYNLFAGKALCGSCHFMPLFNGTVPPVYFEVEYEVIGTPANSRNTKLDADSGRFKFTRYKEQAFAFKTPTVRNIALTAPYMHNGVYNNLEEVVEFYHKGGGAGLGFDLPNQTLPFDSLDLNDRDKEDIVLFMKTLTDTSSIPHAPTKLPVFEKDKAMNKRKVGGIY